MLNETVVVIIDCPILLLVILQYTSLNSIQSLSLSWMNTKIPMMSKLIALREYVKLDTMFKQTLKHGYFHSKAPFLQA